MPRETINNDWVVYGLFDPRDPQQIRYIGKTTRGMAERLYQHVYEASRGNRSAKDNWVRSLGKQGVELSMVELERGCGEGSAESEQGWIRAAKMWGFRLLNLTDGGEGCEGYRHTEESKEKFRHRVLTPEQRAHLSAMLKGRTIHTPESRKRISEGNKGRRLSPEHRQKISAFRTGRPLNEKEREAQKNRRPITEETRKRMSEASKGRVFSAETRAHWSAIKKGKKQSPEHAKHVSEALLKPDSRLARGERSPWSKLTEEKVRQMREKHSQGRTMASLSREYGVSKTTVENIIHREKWKHVL